MSLYATIQKILLECQLLPFTEEEEKLTAEYKLVIDPSRGKQDIKNDCIFLNKHEIYEKILISYGLMQDLILCHMTYSLNALIRHTRSLAHYMESADSKKLEYSMVIKNMGKLYIMRDQFALNRGVIDCPKYSFYKSYLSSYAMVQK